MQRSKVKFLRATFALVSLVLLVLQHNAPSRVAAAGFSTQDAARADAQLVVARVTMRNSEELERFVRLGLDLLELRRGDDLFILTNASQIEELREQGWIIKQDDEQTALLASQKSSLADRLSEAPFMGGYRTVAEMRAALEQSAARYPDLAEVFTYGQSWERVRQGGTGGHELFGIRLTNRQLPGPKPTFFLMAAIHARELSTSELALRFMDYLLSGYGTDPDATWLLDEHQVVIVPVVNPDGRVIAEQGYLQRKNTNTTYGGNCSNPPTAFNQYGVDLNRNASFQWGLVNGPSEPRCGQTYPGPGPASEPETQAIENLVRSLFADQRGTSNTDAAPQTATGVMITLHSFSDLVLWPWGATQQPAPNSNELSLIGRKFASYNGYTAQQSIQLYPTSGTTDDWAYGELGIAAFTFEVGQETGACGGFFPPYSCLDGGTNGAFWPRNLPAFLYAARIARTPYQLASGPTVDAAVVTQAGANLEIRATVNDQSNGNQSIAAAEYYIDTPPWRGGTPHAMTATDGQFNNTSEQVVAAFNASSGRSTVYVRGRDSSGNWGPVTAAFTPAPVTAPDWQTEVTTWKYQGRTYAYVKLLFPSSGYHVANWGVLSGQGSDFTVDAKIERPASAALAVTTSTAQIYDLGALAPGNYTFTFKSYGQTNKSHQFAVNTTTQPNPIDNSNQQEFVRWQYKDFLGREPDAPGLAFWTDNITKCNDPARRPVGQTVEQCIDRQRETTSAAFFMSPEFQYTGYFVYRVYKGSLGRAPYLSEFTQDQMSVGQGIVVNNQLSAAKINENKASFAAQFVGRAEFLNIYGGLSNQEYVNRLFQTTGVGASDADRQALVNGLNNLTETRASVLLKVVDGINVIAEGNQQFTTSYGQAFYNREFNNAFVQMQYFGYMHRDPDAPGYAFWLGKLNQYGNYIDAEMVRSFIVSPEYRARFGQP